MNTSLSVPRAVRFGAAQLTALLLLMEAISVTVPFFTLQTAFRFPDILREPASIALRLFAANQARIVPAYYLFMVSGLLYIPVSVLLRDVLTSPSARPTALNLSIGFGLATALLQIIGFSRWIFVVPYLANRYRPADPATRQTIEVIYETLNRFMGMTVGEHVGFITMGGWTICVAAHLVSLTGFRRVVGYLGLLTGLALIVSVGEHFGTADASLFATLNMVANTLWTVWLLLVAMLVLRT